MLGRTWLPNPALKDLVILFRILPSAVALTISAQVSITLKP